MARRWDFGDEIVLLDKAGLGQFVFYGDGHVGRAHGVSLVAFWCGMIMVWIIPIVAGSQGPW